MRIKSILIFLLGIIVGIGIGNYIDANDASDEQTSSDEYALSDEDASSEVSISSENNNSSEKNVAPETSVPPKRNVVSDRRVSSNRHASSNSDMVLFDEPKQEVKMRTLKVEEVLSNGDALASCNDLSSSFGTDVLFLADGSNSYYDGQIIEVPGGKRLMQIGTYKYRRYSSQKTVPIVKIMNR
ncbi:MAG: hypothetical protein ACOYEA_08315 [Fermentimonas sp.]|jgi:hypothetical protein